MRSFRQEATCECRHQHGAGDRRIVRPGHWRAKFDATITITIVGDDTDGWGLLVTPRYGGPPPRRLGTVQKDLFAMWEPGGNMRFLRDSAGGITHIEVNASEGTVGVLLRPIR